MSWPLAQDQSEGSWPGGYVRLHQLMRPSTCWPGQVHHVQLSGQRPLCLGRSTVAADPCLPRQVGKQLGLGVVHWEFFSLHVRPPWRAQLVADVVRFIQAPQAVGVESPTLPISRRWGSLAAVIDAPCDAMLPWQRACSVTLWVQARKIFAHRGATPQSGKETELSHLSLGPGTTPGRAIRTEPGVRVGPLAFYATFPVGLVALALVAPSAPCFRGAGLGLAGAHVWGWALFCGWLGD